MSAKKELKKNKGKATKKAESGSPTHGKPVKEKVETPDQVINRVTSEFFQAATEIKEEVRDFSVTGLRQMMAMRAALFVSNQMNEPDEEPPWFAKHLFEWAFPVETIKATREVGSGAGGDGVINVISHIPRPDMKVS